MRPAADARGSLAWAKTGSPGRSAVTGIVRNLYIVKWRPPSLTRVWR